MPDDSKRPYEWYSFPFVPILSPFIRSFIQIYISVDVNIVSILAEMPDTAESFYVPTNIQQINFNITIKSLVGDFMFVCAFPIKQTRQRYK